VALDRGDHRFAQQHALTPGAVAVGSDAGRARRVLAHGLRSALAQNFRRHQSAPRRERVVRVEAAERGGQLVRRRAVDGVGDPGRLMVMTTMGPSTS
jgi:hypothetical protein